MNLLKSSLFTFSTNILLFFFSIGSSILVVRMIGPEGKGIMSVVQTFFTLVFAFSYLSLGSGLIFYASKEKNNIKYLNSGLLFSFILSTFILIIGFFFFDFIAETFFKDLPLYYVYFGFGLLYIESVYQTVQAYCRAKRRPLIYNGATLIQRLIYLVVILFLWVGNFKISAIYVLIAYAVGKFSSILFTLFGLKSILKIRIGSFNYIAKMIKFGIKEHIGVIAQNLNLRFDILILAVFLSKEQVGFYSISVVIAQLVSFIPNSISVFLYPKIANLNNEKESAKVISQINRIAFFIVLVIGLLVFMLGGYLIPMMYGEEFIASVSSLRILIFGTIGLSIQKIMTKYFSGIGKPLITSYTAIIGLIINLPLLYFLIPMFGINGAALATSLTYLSMAIVSLFYFLKNTVEKYSIFNLLVINKADIIEIYRKMFS